MTDRPLRPVTDHRLGLPLPNQLANRTQTHPSPDRNPLTTLLPHPVLAQVSLSYPDERGRSSTRYSPVRQCIATLDLHVLGTPPTFVLSQDQTLRCIYMFFYLLF